MTEDEAQQWVAERFGAEVRDRIDALVELILAANERQNLIAPSTVPEIWTRHIVDSLQLLPLAQAGQWLDIGTGAGFPGLAIAAAEPRRDVVLVEPRRLRVDHLRSCAAALALAHVRVVHGRVEGQNLPSAVISARAVASLDRLFGAALPCSDLSTLWLLPKGRSAHAELAEARRTWHGMFHVEQSLTSPDANIVVAQGVSRR